MKLILGLVSVLVTSVLLISFKEKEEQVFENEVVEDVNKVLDHLAELGSKCIFLEAKWDRLQHAEQQTRLQEANHLFTEFEFLQFYLEDKSNYTCDLKGIQDYVLAGENELDQQKRLAAMRKEVEEMYQMLVNQKFDDQALFVALIDVTDELNNMELFRKAKVLKGIAKVLSPFQKVVENGNHNKAYQQVNDLCSYLELISSKDAEGLYILSLQSALENLEMSCSTSKEEVKNFMI